MTQFGTRITKSVFKCCSPKLRIGLLQAQQAVREAGVPVLILVSGVDGAGKGDTVNVLNEWMDPRDLRTFAFGEKSDEERDRPEYWRYWRALPQKGSIGLYVGSWYSDPIAHRVKGDITDAALGARLARIRGFEKTLADDGALIIKFWLHLSKKDQKKRLKTLESHPDTAWRVTRQDKEHLKLYDRFYSIAEHVLHETSTDEAPWTLVEGADERYRRLRVGEHILDRIEQHLASHRHSKSPPVEQPHHRPVASSAHNRLDQLQLNKHLPKKTYKAELQRYQGLLGRLTRAAREKRVSSILVFEGWDAGGKGGVIRRMVKPMDARNYRVISVGAPSDEERARHYLWRFWQHIPRAGAVTIYDRSWYGRVLVERIEGFAQRDEWMRAYAEINDFEEQLAEFGTVIVKYWLHISKEEQWHRFQKREKVAWKQYKITEEDYRNREKWDAYTHAVADMVERTSTTYAPWTLVEGNNKRYARIKALRLYCERLEKALD
ncbi:polyphosphate:AMP phosphotransferase [Thiohalomonas denitrificans]|uniref:Polyphosphate:AMP phosphotransferase n=1 Tax=Thiohalomonas denitrificans TaxID=415747 RepID=A0A1G5PQN1_9GAMM|nr:polyphosphate:AMP phosphotransferase [Thiohalomonas denitrificans]SCZ51763.1 polyphosphate:AMP phosphotransferase [Thiohalomonas denitrificans]